MKKEQIYHLGVKAIVLSAEHEEFLWTNWEKAKTLLLMDFTKFLFLNGLLSQKIMVP